MGRAIDEYFAEYPEELPDYEALTESQQHIYIHRWIAKDAAVQVSVLGATDDAGDLITSREEIVELLKYAIEGEASIQLPNVTWYDDPPNETTFNWGEDGDKTLLTNSPYGNRNDEIWGPAAAIIEEEYEAILDPTGGYTDQELNDLMGPPSSIGQRATDIYAKFQAKYVEIAADKVPSFDGDETDGVLAVEGEFERVEAKDARKDLAKAAEARQAKRTAAQRLASQQVKTIDFKEQCFLLAKIFDLVKIRRTQIEPNERPRTLPYSEDGQPNASLLIEGEPYGMLNKLTAYPSTASLLNLSTADLSQLQPRIELFKVGQDASGNEVSQPITFDGATGKDQLKTLISSKGKRGVGVGIKDFTFSYEGNNPFAVKKSIQASLTLFANSLDDILRERDGYRYIDLALKTGGEKVREALMEARFAEQSVGSVEETPSETSDTLKPHAKSVSNVIDRQIENLSYLNYRIKAVVGWQKPNNSAGISGGEIQTAVNDSFVTLNLTPTIHEFDFDETGRITLKIQYYAFVEESFDERLFNIFSDPGVFKNLTERNLKYRSLDAACGSKPLAEFKKKTREKVQQDKEKALQSIFNMLSARSKIRYMSIPHSELKSFNKEGPYYNLSNLSKMKVQTLKGTQASKAAKNISADIQQNAGGDKEDGKSSIEFVNTKVANANSAQLVFFYLSDLIDVIMAGIETNLKGATHTLIEIEEADKDKMIMQGFLMEESASLAKAYENWKKYRIMLGTAEIVNGANPEQISFANIGDIPISLRYFMEWLTSKTLKKDDVVFPIATFINSLVNNLVSTFLNDDTCFNGDIKQSVRLFQSAITGYKRNKDDPSDPVTYYINKYRKALKKPTIGRLPIDAIYVPKPILNVSGDPSSPVVNPGAENEIHYMFFYAGRVQPVDKQNGDYYQDLRNGIHHYMLGRDRGIIKNIKLKKTDVPYLKEVRYLGNEYDGLAQLREVYDVTIDTYANVNAFPGLYIFVDPRGFVPNMEMNLKQKGFQVDDLSDYGIGGYYMIIRSEHSFGPGKANSTITAKWVAESGQDSKKSVSSPNVESLAKCSIFKGDGESESTGSPVADARVVAKNEYNEIAYGTSDASTGDSTGDAYPESHPEPDQAPSEWGP